MEGAKFCSECGATLEAAPAAMAGPSPPSQPPAVPPLFSGGPPPVARPYSQASYPPPGASPPWGYGFPARRRTALPTAAGVLLIISGVLSMIVWGIVIIAGGSLFGDILPGAATIFAICGAIEYVFAILMIAGGAMALSRRMWGLGLTGSILGLFSIGFIFETSIMSLIALILIAISRDEFR